MNAPARVVDIDEGNEVSVNVEQLGVSAAEINQQIATAKRFPRSMEKFRRELIGNVSLSQEIAQACVYALPRAGKKIEGPSIRFAEMAMAAWGNCRATARIVAETENFIVAQGIFIDLERNVAVGIEVSRRIVDKYGKRYDVDMIGVTGAAASSVALRNAILRGIPKALTDEAYNTAKRTIAGNTATLQERRNRMLEAFKPYNITEQQVLAAIGKQGLTEIGVDELMTLGGFLTAIQQEDKDPEELFPPVQSKARQAPPADPGTQTQSPNGGGSAGAGAPEADGGDGGKGQAPPADKSQRVVGFDPVVGGETEASIAQQLAAATSPEDIKAVASLFGGEIADLDAEAQERVEAMFDQAHARFRTDAADDFPGDKPQPK